MTKANSLFPFRQSIPEKYRKKSGQPVGKELHSIVPRRLSVGEAVVTGVFAPKSSACKIYPPPPREHLESSCCVSVYQPCSARAVHAGYHKIPVRGCRATEFFKRSIFSSLRRRSRPEWKSSSDSPTSARDCPAR